MEVLSDAGTPRLNEEMQNQEDKEEAGVKSVIEKVEEVREEVKKKLDDSLEEATHKAENKVSETAENLNESANKNEDVLGKSVVKESDNDIAKSDSGAGDSEADTKAEDDNTKNNEVSGEMKDPTTSQLALLAGVVAPSIAAGGTVFATAAKRKGEHAKIWRKSKSKEYLSSFPVNSIESA